MSTRKAIYVGTVLGLLLGLTMMDYVIIKELREFRKEMNIQVDDTIPTLESLKYFDDHKLQIDDMEKLEELDDCLVLFLSDECTMCDITKDDFAAFIYYGLADNKNIYFVDINENQNVIGKTIDNQLKNQRIEGTPTLIEIKNKEFKRYEGVDDIYNLLIYYAEM